MMFSDFIKTLPQYLIPKQGITYLAGLLAEVQQPLVKNAFIKTFIRHFNVNMQEALIEDPTKYATFNDFFIRHLKPSARPLAKAKLISPVDGQISEIGPIKQGQLIQAKNRYYCLQEFLGGDPQLAAQFQEGCFATLYLSPKDYHRVHMPLTGVLQKMIYIPGKLFSVQPATTRVIPHLFARNERLVILFDTALGPMAVVMVGATIVGAIETVWHGKVQRNKNKQFYDYRTQTLELQQGQELGHFKLGSTVVLLFPKHQDIQWPPHVRTGQSIQWGEALSF